MAAAKQAPHPQKAPVARPPPKDDKTGWLWLAAGTGTRKMTAKEMEAWEKEGERHSLWTVFSLTELPGDRVQWFRAEADMRRFQEQIEQKLAELKRVIRSFEAMAKTWASLAEQATRPGYAAYARQKSNMYKTMRRTAEETLDTKGYRELRESDAPVAVFVEAQRAREVDRLKAAGERCRARD